MCGTSHSMATRTLSTSMSATSGTRSIGPSGAPPSRPFAASATGCGTRSPMRLPLRLRLTLVFAVGMALVVAGLGAFAYFRTKSDLVASVDAGLRSRAQVLVNSVSRNTDLGGVLVEGKLIDPDEAFAQVLDASGRIVDTSSAVSSAPLLTAGEVRSISKFYF